MPCSSRLDYTNWFPNEPNDASGAEDEVELRMGCDGYACFTGRCEYSNGRQATTLPSDAERSVAAMPTGNDNNGGVGVNGVTGGVRQPFLCQGRARNGASGGGH